MKLELDLMDAKILDILQGDTRVTMAAIGRRIYLRQSALTERLVIQPVN